MLDHMAVLKTIQRQISTHDCPACSGPAYCAMEDGKSSNLCWCMTIKAPVLADADRCLCRRCLTEDRNIGHIE